MSKSWLDQFDETDEDESVQSSTKESERKEFEQMLDASLSAAPKRLKIGDKVRGEILVMGEEEAFVSTGTMTDGLVSRRDLLDENGQCPYKKGDIVELYVVSVRRSEIRLSPNPTSKNLADDLQDAFDMMLPIEGRVTEIVKGGLRVSVMGKTAFCPISQIDSHFVENPEEYVGKKFEFRITQISEGGRNVVVSRRKLLDEQKVLTEGSWLAEHKAGDLVRGKIKRLEKFGAFIEVAPGLEGLAHISELSWSRVNEPSEAVSVGQEVGCKILKIETADQRTRISLSIKQAGAQPWENLPTHIQAGQMVEGKVTRCAKFGAFVELAPGIEGLVPLSEMSHLKRVMRAEEIVNPGEMVMVRILDINPEGRRISLSIKDAGENPWDMVPIHFPVGKVVSGKVERREPYGIFVKIADGITGLLPKSKANEAPDFPFEKFRIGDELQVQIAELRVDERRISLQPPGESDEWKSYVPPAATSGFGSLGDQLKKAMEKKTKK